MSHLQLQDLGLPLQIAYTLLACITIPFLYALYNLYLHPLRAYPGPPLWRAYHLPYILSTQRGTFHTSLKSFHSTYGPIVRIAPNELSYATGPAWKDIYANRGPGHVPFPRNPTWFKKRVKDEPQSIMGPDEEVHAKMRRVFANSFSEKSLREQAGTLELYVSSLIEKFKGLCEGQKGGKGAVEVDLTQWLNYLTFDISGDLSFGESFDCVEKGRMHYWVEIVQDFGKGLALIASINRYPPLDRFLRFVVPRKLMQRQADHRRMSAEMARKRLGMEGTTRADWVAPAKKFVEEKGVSVSEGEWAINMLIVVFAGSETVASALTGIMRELLQSRGVLGRLTTEVREAFGDEGEISVARTAGLKYLNAVINEGLRLCPPVVIGVPRVVPKGGDTICGKWVPGGTYVSYNQYPANLQPTNFHLPNTFIPERFLSSSSPKLATSDDFSTFQPFGIGRHSCLGIKFAYAEMRLVIARLLFSFDLRLADEKNDRWAWGEQRTFILWEKRPLKVVMKKRA